MLPRSAGHRLGARQTAYPFLVAENPGRVGFADQDRLNAPASRELLYGEAAKGKTYQAVRHIHQDSEAYKYGGPAQVDAGILVRLRRIVEEVVPEKD